MYQALYRKYRPRRFHDESEQIDVVGQEHITETLRRQLVSGRLSHAYLFVGTRGTGKTTCAKILARAVNCLNPEDGEPCNKCTSCVGIEDGSILDVLEMDAASHNGVDDVRALRDEAIYTPATVKKRVYIIDEVHMLSTPAFNALLKILEEPPEHILFILATTELHKVPGTIQSRCQNFSFKRLPPYIIAKRLNEIADKEALALTCDAAEKLAALADGSMRNGISLLDQCASKETIDLPHVRDTLGLAGHQELLKLAGAIVGGEVTKALGVVDALYNDGKDMAALLGDIAMLVRDTLIFKLDPDSALLSSSFEKDDLAAFSGKITHERLFFCLDTTKNAIFSLSRSGVSRLAAEMCIIKMCDDRLSDDTTALLSRISQLEAGTRIIMPTPKTSEKPDMQETAHETEAIEPPEEVPTEEIAVDESIGEARIKETAAVETAVDESISEVITKETVGDKSSAIEKSQKESSMPQEIFPWTQDLLNINKPQDDEEEKLSKLNKLKALGANIED